MQTALFKNIRKELLNEIDKAQSQIKVAVAWFTNQDLFEKLCKKVLEGVNVELIVIDDYINNGDWGLDFQQFINNGGKLYYGKEENPMHHKFCIIDNSVMFNGSYNWTYYAESRNVENIIKFTNNVQLNEQFTSEFNRLKQTLTIAKVAIKREMTEMELLNFFSVKNYLAHDLLHKGKKKKEVKFVEAATRLLPKKESFLHEYKQLTEELIVKKTITALGFKSRINGIDNQFRIVIPKNTKVPTSKSTYTYTIHDNQTQILLHAYRGENRHILENTSIGSFLIADLPPKPGGQAGIEVTFVLDKNGVLVVKSRNLATNSYMEAEYHLENITY